jgi:flavin-dependent dehydrogenase
MEEVDVAVVGGGPAGSACAERLVAAGLDVLVVDHARFPRDKPCAGWITPEVLREARLDPGEYARTRTLQPIRRFRVGWIGGGGREVDYGEAVSFGILRRELDAFLLARSGARVRVLSVASVRRDRARWVLNDAVAATWLVGAGGHFCPVARALGGRGPTQGVVLAQELEIRLTPAQSTRCRVAADCPELDFTRDLGGYGWCFRKGDHLNVGLGRRAARSLAGDVRSYVEWLKRSGRIPADLNATLRGHAYGLREGATPRLFGDGALLVGDAAGLAHAASGEGILPAIQSGHVAAEVILDATRGLADAVESYPVRLAERLGPPPAWSLPPSLRPLAGRVLLGSAWLSRHVVLDRFFLHRTPGARVAG